MRTAAIVLASMAAFALSAKALPMYANSDRVTFEHCTDGHRATDERIKACLIAMDITRGFRDDSRYNLIKLYARQRQFNAALDQADRLLADFESSYLDKPTSFGNAQADALERRAWLYAVMGRFDDAVADVNTAAPLEVDDAIPPFRRCEIRGIANRELDAALADCDKAIAVHGRAPYYAARALVHLRMDKLAEALADCNAALDDDARDVYSRYLRGVIENKMGNSTAGVDDIHRATAHDLGIGDELAAYGVAP